MGFYGLQIRPNDGGKEINITSGARAASYLGEFQPFYDDNGATVVQVPGLPALVLLSIIYLVMRTSVLV